MNTRRSVRPFQALILALALAILACGLPVAFTPAGNSSGRSLTGGPTPTRTENPCADFYSEAPSLDIPSAPVENYLTGAGFDIIGAAAWGEGEWLQSTCPSTPPVPSVRTTDLTISLRSADLSDVEALGKLSGRLLDALEQMPYPAPPNWQEGTTTFIFESGTDKVEVAFSGRIALEDLRKQQHLDGEALWRGLNDQPCPSTPKYYRVPEINQPLLAGVRDAGLTNVTILATTSISDCVDPQTGAVTKRTPLGTTFEVKIVAIDLNDKEALGNRAAQVLAIIADIPAGQLGSSRSSEYESRITFNFHLAGIQTFDYDEISYVAAMKAYHDGLKGAELMTEITSR